VGVVTSPGLELASKFFNIGEEYIDQSIHAVFGSRADMVEKFGNDNIQLIQISMADGTDDAAAMREIKAALFGYGMLDAGSGGRIKKEIEIFIRGSLVVFSAVAVASMLVACFGVANLIVASIETRRFEFGVLRAVGAQRGLLTRLVLAEAVVIGLTASIAGTLMGIQGAWAGQADLRAAHRAADGTARAHRPDSGGLGRGVLLHGGRGGARRLCGSTGSGHASCSRRRRAETVRALH
jgi:hypothetical protein